MKKIHTMKILQKACGLIIIVINIITLIRKNVQSIFNSAELKFRKSTSSKKKKKKKKKKFFFFFFEL